MSKQNSEHSKPVPLDCALGAMTLFECGPNKCEHDYSGEEAVLNDRGQVVGGTTVCTKCGARAIDEAYWM